MREGRNRRWPVDSEFMESWKCAKLYESRACQIILECLEESHKHHEIVRFDQASIEHVMPQVLTPEWEAQLGPGASAIQNQWLNTIGNLTLSGYNPELSNKWYSDKKKILSASHYELNKYFESLEKWGPTEINDRAVALSKLAIRIWPHPAQALSKPSAEVKDVPAAFHSECIRVAQQQLGVTLSKLSQTRYESGNKQIRLVCAVSAEHNESLDTSNYWFTVHDSHLDYLKSAPHSWICLGCGSADSTLLLPLSVIEAHLPNMSITKNEDRHCWHVVIQKKTSKLILRLLGMKDGIDLSEFNVLAAVV